MIHLSFHGAAGTVTGSRNLLEVQDTRLLVDCGMFQGLKELRLRNWQDPDFDPAAVTAVILTHAHIDHSGWLPRLVKLGFQGPIHCTPATADLADLLLRDAAHIQEEDAAYANKRGHSKHKPALPLYTLEDAERAIRQIQVVDYDTWSRVGPVRFRFRHAGHILGSGIVDLEVERDGQDPLRLLFSGDVGRYDAPLVPDPEAPGSPDYLVVESTYGNREHPKDPIEEQLATLIRAVTKSRGTLLVPSFAVGRAQQLIYLLRRVMEAGDAPELPIHLDSPMAVNATRIYCRYPEEHGLEEEQMREGDCILYDRNVYLHRTVEESIRLNDLKGPRVIISSSGMLTGGRVLHHLRRLLPHKENWVVLAGYQAPGTRGRRLQDGETRLRVHGRDVPVHARVAEISGLSAHADSEQLMRWLEGMPEAPKRVFVNHGEPPASQAMALRLEARRGFSCEVPEYGERFELDG